MKTKQLFSLPPQNISGHSVDHDRADFDYYATPFYATEAILDRVSLGDDIILEPSSGEGHIVKVLKERYPNNTIIANDIISRDSRLGIAVNGGVDFLQYTPDVKINSIITNPPFSLAKEFIEKAISIADHYVLMLCKIQLLEGIDRKKLFDKHPPKYVYVFSKRVSTLRNGDEFDPNGKQWATTMCLAWYVFEVGYTGETIIRWI